MKRERIFWGVLFILIGIFLIVSKLGYFPNVNVFSLLVTIFLVVIIIKSLIRLNFAGILFPIAFICIIYDKQLGITNITPWTVLIAATFGSIGLSMIFHRPMKCINNKDNYKNKNYERINVEDENYVKFDNSFCASIKYINTNKFEQGDFNCSFGALKVYFDNAIMNSDTATVRIDASFSGVELYIPKNWNVQDKTNVFLGSVTEKNKTNEIITNTLILIGDVSFSGVDIIYV
ncbi:LiaF domain-containing protein [Eubacterium multiforme]|uniref:Membrane protein n=1 Tax=Eubacterium multiforme TaxID=83339 RepID=A0ABT9UXU6_9FIRM|nr:LiaF domain-containing protein [Eubacterium multiforme]MDQ0151147.1 putative membrane protein [Eubacterium multiforme]